MKQRVFLFFVLFFLAGIHGALAQITAPATSLCAGTSMTLSDALPSGTWTSGNTAVATVGSSSGIVSGVSAGTVIISYTTSLIFSSITLTVNPAPSILGSNSVCVGDQFIMIDTLDSGSVWISSNTAVITFDSAITFPGVSIAFLTADTNGTSIISFTNSYGCTASQTVTVSATLPPITGPSNLCAGATITLSDSVGGKWLTQDTSLVSVDSLTGVVHGLSAGMANVIFIDSLHGCVLFSTINVQSVPVPDVIAVVGTACVGDSVQLYDGAGLGSWSASNPSVATVSAAGALTGISAGTVTVTFTMTNICGTGDTTLQLSFANCNVGVRQVTKQAAIELSPNPCSGRFTFSLPSDVKEPVQVEISNLLGQRISAFSASTNETLEVTLDAAPGVYMLSAKTAQGHYNTRIVVQ